VRPATNKENEPRISQRGKAATKEIEQEETGVTEIFFFRSLFSPFSPGQFLR
jgi:hypothetical protein